MQKIHRRTKTTGDMQNSDLKIITVPGVNSLNLNYYRHCEEVEFISGDEAILKLIKL